MPASFLWYDLETWGTDPRRQRIAQFAAQRTDLELNPLGEPQTVWFAPAHDVLPSPMAALITGLDPFELARSGAREAVAMQAVEAVLAVPETCSVGWNTLRFDDEFIRHTLYRNFHDPYAREYAQGNSRWDLLDFARFAYALRPDGIVWPSREDGAPSFRLEHLAAANGVQHSAAHDARSDVEATVGMARKLRAAQPKLWDYHLGLRDKRRVADLLNPARGEPLLHVSPKFPASRGCAGIVLPLAPHPRAGNQMIVVELHEAVDDWLDAPPEAIAARVFARQQDLPDGVTRIALKAVHLNRAPALTHLAHVRAGEMQRLGLDREHCLRQAEKLRAVDDLVERVQQAFAREWPASDDVDDQLYERLPDRRDDRLRAQIRRARPDQLAGFSDAFHDSRGNELLWRYRARNWPDQLNNEEQQRWQHEVAERLSEPSNPAGWQAFTRELAEARRVSTENPAQITLLDRVEVWANSIAATTGRR